MKEPSGELVELDFYFSDRTDVDALRDISMHCIKNGGKYSGELLVSHHENARTHKFQNIYSSKVRVIEVSDSRLLDTLNDGNTRVVKVPIYLALGIIKKRPEIVTYNPVSNKASGKDYHPVAIVSEGWEFSTPGYELQAKKAGKLCYEKLKAVCTDLNPDYAAILNENSLPSPHDLEPETADYYFSDFYVCSSAYGTNTISKIEAMYDDSYLERLPGGIYVSSYHVYNPKRITIDRRNTNRRSRKVAALLKKT